MEPSPAFTEKIQAIEIFRRAVETARELVFKQGENEKIDLAVQPNLTLDLKRKGIAYLPDEVIYILYRDVERIVLSHNLISRLPARFSDCSAMQYLNLRGNKFSEFPEVLSRMEKLQILDLSRNSIEVLPDRIKGMKSLRVLSVMHNRITDLPLSLGSLESLRILKITGNPLNEQLRVMVDSNESATSPLSAPIAENEKDTLLTLKLKQHLHNEMIASESGGESSSEGPLETPKPLKRNPSIRFPVIPAKSIDLASDTRSTTISKPPIPNRSHYRMGSGQSILQIGINSRRVNISSLSGNERNRSNSEHLLQSTQNSRNKRMGMITRKTGLSPLEEAATNRNSLHLRGTSHGSVLKDRNIKGTITSELVDFADYFQQPGIFIRQLSSMPEHRSFHGSKESNIEGAKGLLFSLHSLHPYLSYLLPLASEEGAKRSSLERVFYNSSTHLDTLDHELCLHQLLPENDNQRRRRAIHTIFQACKDCIVAYIQVGRLIIKNARQILTKGDQRYIRMLLLLMNGSTIEALNSLCNFKNGVLHLSDVHSGQRSLSVPRKEVPMLTIRAMTPTKDKLSATRKLQTNAISSQRTNSTSVHMFNKSISHSQAPVPLYVNGRSRSSSRPNVFYNSASSYSGIPPGSAESFPALGHAIFGGPENGALSTDTRDFAFENIYQRLQKFVNHALSSLPAVCSIFRRCFEEYQARPDTCQNIYLWSRLYSRSQQTLDLCERLNFSLSDLKLHDLDLQNSEDFWNKVTRFTNCFVHLCEEVKSGTAANRDRMMQLDILRLLKPVHKCVRIAIQTIQESPWAYVLANSSSFPHTMYQDKWQLHTQLGEFAGPKLNNHFYSRTRGDSGSSSSPFMPTTPLSAALGAAAQATIPTGTLNSAVSERIGQPTSNNELASR